MAAEPAPGSDWPGFLGPNANSKSPERGILTRWPAGGPPVVWTIELGTGYSMPVVSQGRLYQFDRVQKLARLRCFDARGGRLRWTFEYATDFRDLYGYNNGPRCCPVVDGDRVYCFGAEGMLHCLDTASGAKRWSVDTAARFGVVQNFFGVGSTPVVEGDLLIVQIGGSPPEDQAVSPGQLQRVQGNGSCVVAFDKRTGEVVHSISDDLASYASPVLATIGGRRWCFVFARDGLLAFEPTTGKIDFRYPWRARIVESVNASNPVVVGNRVFISESYGPGSSLLEVRPGGYRVVWADSPNKRHKAMQTHWNTPIYHDGYLYGSSGRHRGNAELRCIELATGKTAWSQPGLTRCSLLYVDGHFICLAEDGTLRLLKATPRAYQPLAEVVLRATEDDDRGRLRRGDPLIEPDAWAAPILSHGLLYVRGRDRLVCLELIPEAADADRAPQARTAR